MYSSSIGNRINERTYDENRLIRHICENPSVRAAELAEFLGVSERTVRREINKLKEAGVLVRINGKRYGRWYVNV